VGQPEKSWKNVAVRSESGRYDSGMGIGRLSLGGNFSVKSMSGTRRVSKAVATPTQTWGGRQY